MKKFKLKPKQPKAVWTKTAFGKAQQQRLRPEATAAGGVKARSGSETQRMDIYRAIKDLYIRQKPWCEACQVLCTILQPADEIHHKHGRSGLLLLDVRHWMAVCSRCHVYIHEHPNAARSAGLLAARGEWGRQPE